MAVAACAIEQFHIWSSTHDQSLPALEQIPAMQRRRLSPLAKIALSVTMQSVDALKQLQQAADYIVWASRFGDEQKTLGILKDISLSQTPSPTAFSTSVHNAIAGLYSILCQDATPSTSLSAGEETFSQGFIEACALLQSGAAERVLLVYYDQALPDIYSGVPTVQQPMLALTLILARTDVANIQLTLADIVQPVNSHEAVAFYQHYLSGSTGQWQHGRYVWEKT
jgi:3-oxoacyl-(acyl-carrier-protein) synthase